jgi:thiosulfate/3-mercaptopyruvate sulfurtransferase
MAEINSLVETDWLEAHLSDADLCVYDCTTIYSSPDNQRMQFDGGRSGYDEGHVPGAAFIDVLGELSDGASPLRTMMPPVEQFAAAMSRYGIGEGVRVVLYDNQLNMWATRVWWMLRAMGFDDAAVLNGGWHKWTKEGRPVSTEQPAIPAATFVAKPRPDLFADKNMVLDAIGQNESQVVSALTQEMHAGEGLEVVQRGHITSSTCVGFTEIVDLETMAYLPLDELRKKFDAAGATADKQVITYCGTGIAATSDAFAMHLLGRDNVAVYDGSLEEWSADPELPMEM